VLELEQAVRCTPGERRRKVDIGKKREVGKDRRRETERGI
jgi:hypothetical protein